MKSRSDQRMASQELDSKSKLVEEICSLASSSSPPTITIPSCFHRRRSSAFIDWYRLLQIKEDSGSDVIRRRYRKLALQLHPDKNRHPQAEVAFKLISEAYACLSDKSRRKAFDNDRLKNNNNNCKECQRNRPLRNHTTTDHDDQTSTNKDMKQRYSSSRIHQALKEVQNRLREECIVIETCLRSNRSSLSRTESPLFNPSDKFSYQNYPHGVATSSSAPPRFCRRDAHEFESPVYQIRSEKFRSGRARTPGF